jgi:hypothetical protein
MLSLAEDYLAERRRLGFELTISGARLKAFVRFVDDSGHTGAQPELFQGKSRHAGCLGGSPHLLRPRCEIYRFSPTRRRVP